MPKAPHMTPLEEQNAFFDAIGKSVHHWTAVEHALGLVFCGCISGTDTHSDDGVPLAAFYAVENFRSKLNMVDAAVKARLDKNDLLKNWTGSLVAKGFLIRHKKRLYGAISLYIIRLLLPLIMSQAQLYLSQTLITHIYIQGLEKR